MLGQKACKDPIIWGGSWSLQQAPEKGGNHPVNFSLLVGVRYQPCEMGCKFPEYLVAISLPGVHVPRGSSQEQSCTGSSVQPWLVGEPACFFVSQVPCLSGPAGSHGPGSNSVTALATTPGLWLLSVKSGDAVLRCGRDQPCSPIPGTAPGHHLQDSQQSAHFWNFC